MEVLIENIVSRTNVMIAYNEIVGKKGSSGVDGMDVSELKDYLKSHWSEVRQRILTNSLLDYR